MDDELVRVYASADPFEGELRRGFLEAEGVPVMLKGGAESPYRLGPVYLFVPTGYELKARVLLDAVAKGEFEPSGEFERSSEFERSECEPSGEFERSEFERSECEPSGEFERSEFEPSGNEIAAKPGEGA